MTFSAPLALLLLLLVPAMIVLFNFFETKRKRSARGFAEEHLLKSVLKQEQPAHKNWPLALQLAALTCFFVAGSGPIASLWLPTNKAAVIIALDASKSMLADDIKPSRLEAARVLIKKFSELAPASTKIGLVSFSESASVLQPPTTDRQAFLEALARVKPANATSVAQAVAQAVRALPGREKAILPEGLSLRNSKPKNLDAKPLVKTAAALPPGAILVLSDGVSNSGGDPKNQTMLAAKFATEQKVKLYAVGVGKEGGAVTTINGQNYFVPFDGASLQQLAQLGGGKYVAKPDLASLKNIFKELGVAIQPEKQTLPLAGPLSGMAAMLMLTGAALSLRWQRRIP